MEDVTYSPLTVDYHEDQFLVQLNNENSRRHQDPDFRLPLVPTNSIAFDRYAYSFNNPIRYVDPNGHNPFLIALLAVLSNPVVAVGVLCLAAAAAIVVLAVGPENVAQAAVDLGNNIGDAVSEISGKAKKPSPNQLNQLIKKGKAPKGLTRVDTPKTKGEQEHVHFGDDIALNKDGTWKHGKIGLTNEQIEWLMKNGWKIPK
jgi:hypothetical protein